MIELAATRLAGDSGQADLLVVGPSLGTSVSALWSDFAVQLGERFDVIGWDLPGHGRSAPAAEPFSVGDLAQAVRDLAGERGAGRRCWYAGVSLGGMVGLELARRDGPFDAVAVIAAAASIGEPSRWHERAALVRQAGTTVLAEAATKRWFAPGFIERRPDVAARLLAALIDADEDSYAAACEALARDDLRAGLHDVCVPLLLLPGAHDTVVSIAQAQDAASIAPGATLRILDSCGHLPPAEDPVTLAALLADFFTRSRDRIPDSAEPSTSSRRAAGTAVRREVLGDEHVDAAEARKDAFTAPFQDFITRYAWGEIWTRPGLNRLTRSAITLTALVALGHWSEFELHVRAARRNGLTQAEIGEVLLHVAIYCGVPAANHAFAVARSVLQEAS